MGIPSHGVGAAGCSQEIPSLGTGASGHPPAPVLPAHRKQASTIVYCSQASLPHCQRRGHAPQRAWRRCQVYKLPAKSPSLFGNDASLFLCFHERTNRNLPGRVWREVTLGPRPHFCPEGSQNTLSLWRMVSWVHRGGHPFVTSSKSPRLEASWGPGLCGKLKNHTFSVHAWRQIQDSIPQGSQRQCDPSIPHLSSLS